MVIDINRNKGLIGNIPWVNSRQRLSIRRLGGVGAGSCLSIEVSESSIAGSYSQVVGIF